MADIFMSYVGEDEARIRPLICILADQGWSVFWDRRIPAGQTWRSYIGQALSDARCVIVAWSRHSIASGWVSEEADEGKQRGILVPVLLDAVEPPIGFRSIQAADLTEWQPGHHSLRFEQLLLDIHSVLAAAPRSPTPEPSLKVPRISSKVSWRLLASTIVAIVALVLVVGVIYRRDLWKNVQPLYTDTGTYHLGDETIKNWSNLYGNCFEAEFSLNWPIRNLALQLETYGVENSSIKLNGRRVASLPPQPIQPGTGRPNYWSSERSVPLPTHVLNPSIKNTLALCSEPVADPQFSGDLDDFQFRNLKITAEK